MHLYRLECSGHYFFNPFNTFKIYKYKLELASCNTSFPMYYQGASSLPPSLFFCLTPIFNSSLAPSFPQKSIKFSLDHFSPCLCFLMDFTEPTPVCPRDYTSRTAKFSGGDAAPRSSSSRCSPAPRGLTLVNTCCVVAGFLRAHGYPPQCIALPAGRLWLCGTRSPNTTPVPPFSHTLQKAGTLARRLCRRRDWRESAAKSSWHNAVQESDERKRKRVFGFLSSFFPSYLIRNMNIVIENRLKDSASACSFFTGFRSQGFFFFKRKPKQPTKPQN